MLFNSLHFALFFPAAAVLYFALPERHRWKFLLAASYYFYMCWKAHYILLIVASTLVDYWAGLKMGGFKTKTARRPYLYASLAANLGLLFAFKYFNFAAASLEALFARFNVLADIPAFDVLLPVGISFYTFQTLSYSIEVYWGKIKPERHLGKFALYVAFFPQLVAGPIERAERLLPQFSRPHRFDYDRVRSGLIRMLWGFYKKLVIADRLAFYVNQVFEKGSPAQGEQMLLAVYLFAFQIYCDFSGYSDIAVGAARVLGYDLMENFRRPYYSKSIAEFWRRWHISLSTWFKDYVYIPLGGSRTAKTRWYLNLLIVFTVSGLWHGANWTFVVWGAYHGLLLILGTLFTFAFLDRSRLGRVLKTVATFHLVCLGWVFFRAESLTQALRFLSGIAVLPARYLQAAADGRLADTLAAAWRAFPVGEFPLGLFLAAIILLETAERVEEREELSGWIAARSTPARWSFYLAAAWILLRYGEFGSEKFIYFQF